MSAAHTAGSHAAHLIAPISAARTACPGQPGRAEHSEPRSGALDRPPQRSYPYRQHTTARPHRCGLIDSPICGVSSDTPHPQAYTATANATTTPKTPAGPNPTRSTKQPTYAKPTSTRTLVQTPSTSPTQQDVLVSATF
jgi:hypothetical protein